MELMSFHGKVVLVTGGGSGIGKEMAIKFAEAGAKVVVSGRSVPKLEETVKRIKLNGGESFAFPADISSSSDVKKLFERIIDQFSHIDIACNCASTVTDITHLESISEDEFESVVSINLKGTWLCMKHEILEMKKQGSGVILNISSINGIGGTPGVAIYGATKAAINNLTKTAALENAKIPIRINAICPGPVKAPLLTEVMNQTGTTENNYQAVIPQGRIGDVEEIANSALWICSDHNSYMTGQIISIDGGLTAKG